MDDPTQKIKQMLEDAVLRKKQNATFDNFKQIADLTVAHIAESISPDDVSAAIVDRIAGAVEPAVKGLLEKEKASTADIIAAIKAIQLNVPEMKMPEMPEMQAPIVNVPAPIVNVPAPIVNVEAPIVNVPAIEFPEQLPYPTEFSIRGLNPKNPLPVQMVDMAGKPYFPGGSAGATGGKADFFTIQGFNSSIGAALIDSSGAQYTSSNPFPVTITSGSTATSASNIVDSSGIAYTGSNPLPVTFAGSSSTSVSLVNADGVYYNSANPFPTTATLSAVTGQGDGASALRIIQAGDTVSSVVVNSGTLTAVTAITNSVSAALVDSSGVAYSGSNPLPTTASVTLSAATGQGDGAAALRTIQAGDTVSSVIVNSGTLTAVTSITNSVASALVDSGGVAYSGSNPVPISGAVTASGTVAVSGITNSVASALVDSSGVAYSGSNPLPTTASISLPFGQGDSATATRFIQAGDSVSSVIVNSGTLTAVTSITNSVSAALVDSSGVAYSGSNPLPTTASVSLTLPSGPGDGATATRFIQAGDTVSSVIVNSGTLTAVTSITNSIASALVDSSGVAYSGSNPFPTTASISLPFGQGDTATATRIVQAGDSVSSVIVNSGTLTAVTSITNSIAAAIVDSSGVEYSGSNPFPVTITSGGSATSASNIVDSSGVAYTGSNPVPITGTVVVSSVTASLAASIVDSSGIGYSGSNPVPVSNVGLPVGQGDGATAQRVIQAGDTVSSVVVNSGTITAVTSITNSVASSLIDSGGVQYSGSNPVPIAGSVTATGTVAVSSITSSVAATLVDSSGIAYSGSNPFPTTASATLSAATGQGDTASALRVVHAGDSAASVMSQAVGTNETTVGVLRTVTMSDTASSSQTKLIAMTTLPTAVADAASTFQKSDKLGREINRPINVRDLITTSRAQVTIGSAETTLATASAGQFLDLISVLFANQSTNAISVDLRSLAGGNIEQTIEVPATATAGWTPPVPWPMGNSGNAWTFQLSLTDQSGTTFTGTALFSNES